MNTVAGVIGIYGLKLKLKLLLEGEKPKGASEVKSSSADLPSRLQKSGSL